MSRIISSLALLTFVVSLGGLADAKSCHGANGKFVKCPTKVSTPANKDAKGHCHGANGKFVKCSK
jgi:hypothetical protein